MSSKRTSRAAARPAAWAVVVRLANGERLFCANSQGTTRWTPHERDAQMFQAETAARDFADGCEINSAAREYAVVVLPKR